MSNSVNILLVSADQALLALLKDAGLSGDTVTEANEVTQAKGIVANFKPALLLISEQLPDGPGLDFAQELFQRYPLLVTVLFSPPDSKLAIHEVLTAGVSDWHKSPLEAQAIRQIVDEALDRVQHNQNWLKHENRRTTGSLRQQVIELDTILTQIQDGVIVISEDDTLLMINPIARKAFKLGDEDLAGKPYNQVFNHRDLLMTIRGETPDPSKIEIKTDEKSYFRAASLVIPGIGRVISLHDISYLKELNRMKTDFVNTVSHDLRSPLTSILGYIELIRRAGEINRQQSDYIDQVQESVHQITKLINEVLDLGRIENRLDKNFSKVSLLDLTKEVLVNLRPMINQVEHQLVLEFSQDLPLILGDSMQLRQMIENLVGNAIKYTPKGGTITIRGAQEQNMVIFQVKDTGRGIPLEDQYKVYEPFYRSKNVSEDTQGTGLGLAITKSVVENHRGRIWVDSHLGQGSTFTVVLPILE